MKDLIKIGIFVLLAFAHTEGLCTIASIHANANKCLTDNMMEPGTDFIVPVVNGSAGVINFCKRTISDIKNCITSVISTCASDKKVKSIFGFMGSALLAGYTGICKEETKEHDMTCIYDGFAHMIQDIVNETVSEIDMVDPQTGTLHDMCRPVQHLHTRVMELYDEAIAHGHCTEGNKNVMHEYLSTVVFPCQDVATSYYPCTLKRLNSDIIQCYASYGAIVKDGIIPTPTSLTHAGEMCFLGYVKAFSAPTDVFLAFSHLVSVPALSWLRLVNGNPHTVLKMDGSKGMIQGCIKNLITKCLYEPQISAIFGATGEPFVAAYNCMCSLDNSDMVLTCASTANISSAIAMFMNTIHNHSINGMLDMAAQCKEEQSLRTELENKINDACADPHMRAHWHMFIGTLFYSCIDEPTQCYPHNKFNGAESNNSLREMLVLIFSLNVLGLLFWY